MPWRSGEVVRESKSSPRKVDGGSDWKRRCGFGAASEGLGRGWGES